MTQYALAVGIPKLCEAPDGVNYHASMVCQFYGAGLLVAI